MATTTIEVTKLSPVQNQGNLRGFASVKIGWLAINDLRIIQQDGQRPFVSMPQRAYTDAAGNQQWAYIVYCDREHMAPIQDAVLAAWENQRPAPTGNRRAAPQPQQQPQQPRQPQQQSYSRQNPEPWDDDAPADPFLPDERGYSASPARGGRV